MHHQLPFFALSLLAAGTAHAQDYRPCRAGLTYQLSEVAAPGDTTHALRLGAGREVGADSVFQFAARTSRTLQAGSVYCGSYVVRPDNLFGATLTVRGNSEFVLSAANGRTLTLRPRAAIGQAWPAAASLTGRVTARYLGPAGLLPRPDSLVAITFSDGATVLISKTYGFLQGPALGHYLNPRVPARALQLTALPELGLGSRRLGALVAYDFQPGDVFLRYTSGYDGWGPCGYYVWTRDSVLARINSRRGDTISYQIQRRTLTRRCSNGPGTLAPATTIALTITSNYRALGQLTEFWENRFSTSPGVGFIHSVSHRTNAYNGRLLQQHVQYQTCSTGMAADTIKLANTSSLDFGVELTTAPGLGEVREANIGLSGDLTVLLGYRKGSETWGQLTTFAQLLPTAVARPAAGTAAFPNPFAAELSVSFELPRAQAVGLELRDALGRVVLTQPATQCAAGSCQLQLSTAAVSPGLYTLMLKPAAGPAQVLKVLKAQ
jgi:hypothetical protein